MNSLGKVLYFNSDEMHRKYEAQMTRIKNLCRFNLGSYAPPLSEYPPLVVKLIFQGLETPKEGEKLIKMNRQLQSRLRY
jgi:hypothetical protein